LFNSSLVNLEVNFNPESPRYLNLPVDGLGSRLRYNLLQKSVYIAAHLPKFPQKNAMSLIYTTWILLSQKIPMFGVVVFLEKAKNSKQASVGQKKY